jgi:two-component system, OmpR family, alkaline phosphatase synthesis response regulator PhoP
MLSSGPALLAAELGRVIEILDVAQQGLALDTTARDRVAVEAVARLRALQVVITPQIPEDHLTLGLLCIDFRNHQVRLADQHVHLTPREFSLLCFLARNRGRVWKRKQILAEVWADAELTSSRTVDIHVYRLRAKLAPHADAIETVRQVGYIWRTES